jgi:hypothetical protein
MKEKRLLLKTKDGREFVTYQKNIKYLMKFVETFDAEIFSIAVLQKTKSLQIKDLTTAICNQNYKNENDYKIIKKIYPKNEKSKDKELDISDFINKKLLSGESISLDIIKKQYKKNTLENNNLYYCINKVKKELTKKGYNFTKIKVGEYCITLKK